MIDLFNDNRNTIKRQIASCYNAPKNDIQKANEAVPLGTKSKGKNGDIYIKTKDGWKYYGKGEGEKAQSHAGGGVAVKKGSKVTNQDGLTGTVLVRDEKHTHIEWKDKKDKKQLSKVPNDHFDQRVVSGEYTHSVPVGEVVKLSKQLIKKK